MVGNFLRRFGLGLVAAVLGMAAEYFVTADFTELGLLAALAAAAAALIAGGLLKLRDKVLSYLGDQ